MALLFLVISYYQGWIGVKNLQETHDQYVVHSLKHNNSKRIEIQFIRNATLLIKMNGKRLLVDPMLADIGTIKPVPFTLNRVKNPTVPLPVPVEELTDVQGILVTHRHFDHFDEVAKSRLPKEIPLFCQPEDAKKFKKDGYSQVKPVNKTIVWEGIKITRILGKHGTGLVGELMGSVSGFLLEHNEEKIYIAGDTVLNKNIEEQIDKYKPQIIVLNTGAAKLYFGKPITMTKEEVIKIAQMATSSKIIAVHLEAINHCTLSRDELHSYMKEHKLEQRIIIPNDGEIIPILSQ